MACPMLSISRFPGGRCGGMQYLLLVWVVGVFTVVIVTLRRWGRRTTRLLPSSITTSAPPLTRFGGGGAVWASASGSARAAGMPGLGLTLFPWGVRFGTTSRLVGWAIPTIELSFSELRGDAVRSKLRTQGVRLRSVTDPHLSIILWTSQWSHLLDALAYHGAAVDKEIRALDWTYQ